MRVVIVGPNLPHQAQAEFHVHAEGCADLKRGWIRPYARGEQAFDYPSRRALVESVYCDIIAERPEDDDNSDLDNEFYYAPCVADLPEQVDLDNEREWTLHTDPKFDPEGADERSE